MIQIIIKKTKLNYSNKIKDFELFSLNKKFKAY